MWVALERLHKLQKDLTRKLITAELITAELIEKLRELSSFYLVIIGDKGALSSTMAESLITK